MRHAFEIDIHRGIDLLENGEFCLDQILVGELHGVEPVEDGVVGRKGGTAIGIPVRVKREKTAESAVHRPATIRPILFPDFSVQVMASHKRREHLEFCAVGMCVRDPAQ